MDCYFVSGFCGIDRGVWVFGRFDCKENFINFVYCFFSILVF